ncbi:cation diffusion facilitator family transporter [uncultured Parabacteroides sp.]|uniref:cation diffusion facilitator family transporter n=1 Tax=uncultured Parabacteroides sp. TaxID=512312 RepID=UPI0025CD05CA|nr:cation diffusion facilitator family transporter [uncultured Parabacteroides sp.]
MNENNLAIKKIDNIENESIDFDSLEKQLQEDLTEQLEELDILKSNAEKIGNPDTLGEVVLNVVWEQVINQIGVVAGEDFIAENRGLKLDLRKDAHIQTTENFANGKIASHNAKIDYQQRYDDWQSNFKRDENGEIIKKYDRIDKVNKEVLVDGYREPYDKGRRKGSAAVHMDETISVGEQVRDPAANAHLTIEERVKFDQSDTNLNPMDASANESKRDHNAINWLESERNGQKPAERFNIDEKQIREKDIEARTEYKKLKEEGEKRSIEAGKQSQKEEAFRIGGKALRAVVMGLLLALIKDIIKALVAWFRASQKNFSSFIEKMKEAIRIFFSNIKRHLCIAADTLLTTVLTSILGLIVNLIKKAYLFLKQGYKSIKDAINYIKDPVNKNKPFEILLLEVGKIITGALTVGGAMILGETIEKLLITIPAFAIEIPLLGSLASILGIFFGALTSGIIGAIVLNLIDRRIAKKQKRLNNQRQFQKRNKVLLAQEQLINVSEQDLVRTKSENISNINERHRLAKEIIERYINQKDDEYSDNSLPQKTNEDKFNDIFNDLNNM